MKKRHSVIRPWYTITQNKRVQFIARFEELQPLVNVFSGNYHTVDNINAAEKAGFVTSDCYISDIVTKKEIDSTIQFVTEKLMEKYESGKSILEPDYAIERMVIKLFENALYKRQQNGRPFSMEEVKAVYGLHFTLDHKGKMSGMQSLSTTCKANDFCRARIEMAAEIAALDYSDDDDGKKVIICGGCFSEDQANHYGRDYIKPFLYNLYILNRFIIPVDILPVMNCRVFRIESFGDLQGEPQQINFFNIMNVNPKTRFSQWSKNPGIIARVLLGVCNRPENVKFIYSELILNSTRTLEDIKDRWPFFDAIFRVFTLPYLKRHPEIKINCGANHCLTCGNSCYDGDGSATEINEVFNTPGSKNKARAERNKKGV